MGAVYESVCKRQPLLPVAGDVAVGQYSHNHGVTINVLASQFRADPAVPVWLDRAGCRTGLVGKYLNGFPWDKGPDYKPPGWDVFRTGGLRGADAHTERALTFIERSRAPWFLYLAYRDPHQPATPPPRYRTADVFVPPERPNLNEVDVSDRPQWIRSLPLLTPERLDALRRERRAGQRALLAVDDEVQRIMKALREKRHTSLAARLDALLDSRPTAGARLPRVPPG